MPDRLLTRHDTHEGPRVLLLDATGTPINLTGCTVRYSLRHLRTRVLKITRAATTLADQAISPGEVSYTLQAADVDTSGTYQEEWEVTYSGGTKETFPRGGEAQVVRILDDLDNV